MITALVGLRDAAARWGVAGKSAAAIVEAGLVDGYRVGEGGLYVTQSDADALAARPTIQVTLPALVVRVGAAVRLSDEDTITQGRHLVGWAEPATLVAGQTWSLTERLKGIDRFWRVSAAQPSDIDRVFCATVSGLVAAVGQVQSITATPLGAIIGVAWGDQPGYPVGGWLRSGPGGPVVRLDPPAEQP